MSASLHPVDPAMTRRGLLAAGGAALVAVSVAEAGPVVNAVAALGSAGVPAYLRRSTYESLVGERFGLTGHHRRTTARLVAVENLGSSRKARAQAPREDAFALVFHDPGPVRLTQDVMTLTHPKLGRFRLLVSPASTGRVGQDYAAVINRAARPRR